MFSSNPHSHPTSDSGSLERAVLYCQWSVNQNLHFLTPPTCHDFTFILGSTRLVLKQNKQINRSVYGKELLWLQSTLVMFSSSHYLDELCFISGPDTMVTLIPRPYTFPLECSSYHLSKSVFSSLIERDYVLHLYIPSRHLA